MRASRRWRRARRARSAMSNMPMRCRTSSTYTKLINHDGATLSPAASLPGRRGQCRLEERAGLLPVAHRPAGQGELADHRRDLHPDAQEAGETRTGRKRCSLSSTGPIRTAQQMAESLAYVPMPPERGGDFRRELEADRRPRWQAGVARAPVLKPSGGRLRPPAPASMTLRG